ncbi:RNase P protein subunit [Tieghemostelium lacteum]|uniref:RNase P protein subunit n=1 Tax=Tieghemostelium lacteum TaxID=361077 RepID=A0A151ZDT9_TIELA|nr:RNase P protein subunit [Tieghemostelium lacteum]|eukprot:KYQ92095.1 RNase P protein subunit [Tieghemostelium lacteum]
MVRLKNRYFLTEVIWHDKEKTSLLSDIWMYPFIIEQSKKLIGELTTEAYKKTVKFVYVNSDTNVFIVRCGFDFYKSLWAALSLITEYEGIPVYFRVIHISGSIRSCQRVAIDEFNQNISVYNYFKATQSKTATTQVQLPITMEFPSEEEDNDEDDEKNNNDEEDKMEY